MGMYTGVPALQVHQQDPIGEYAKLVGLQALQANQKFQQQMQPLQLQEAQTQLQQAQQQQADQKAMRDAMIDWDGRDYNDLAQSALQKGASANAANAIRQQALQMREMYSKMAAQDAETGSKQIAMMKAKNDMLLGHLETLDGVEDDKLSEALLAEAGAAASKGLISQSDLPQIQSIAQLPPAQARQALKMYEKTLMGHEQVLSDATKQADIEQKRRQALFGTGQMADYISAHLSAAGLAPTPQNIAKMQEQYNRETKIEPGVAKMSILLQRPVPAVDENGNPILATQAQAAKAANAGTPLGAPQFNPGVQASLAASKEAVAKVPVIQTALHHLDQMESAAKAYDTGNVKFLNEIAKRYGVQVGNTPLATYMGIEEIIKGDILAASSAVGAKNEKEEQAIQNLTDPAIPVKAKLASFGAIKQLMRDRLKAKGEVYRQASSGNVQNIFTPQTGGGTVKMKAPNGATKDIPADQVEHYKSLGATVVEK